MGWSVLLGEESLGVLSYAMISTAGSGARSRVVSLDGLNNEIITRSQLLLSFETAFGSKCLTYFIIKLRGGSLLLSPSLHDRWVLRRHLDGPA